MKRENLFCVLKKTFRVALGTKIISGFKMKEEEENNNNLSAKYVLIFDNMQRQ